MLVVLSPAKTLDFATPLPVAVENRQFTQPSLLQESKRLIKTLRKLSPEDLSELMHISPALGELNFRRNANWRAPFDSDNAKPALYAFTGDVYVGLEARKLSATDVVFANQHVRILSGLYGLLKPLDLMQAYRLEMGARLRHGDTDNLYAFWGDRITRQLNAALKQQKSGLLVNLASNEYFRAVKEKALTADVINPVFRDFKNGQYKVISFFAKKARGMMTAFVIRNRITDHTDLQRFDLDGYRYSAKDSTEKAPVFLRKALG